MARTQSKPRKRQAKSQSSSRALQDATTVVTSSRIETTVVEEAVNTDDAPNEGRNDENEPIISQSLNASYTRHVSITITNKSLATNGPLQNGPRASPAPSQGMPPVPNGKPTSPYTEQRNPMSPGSTQQIANQTVSSKDPKAAAQAASDMRNVVRRKLTGYVGFANLPNQWHRKSVRKGFNFNVMVVGEYYSCCPLQVETKLYR